MTRWLLLFLALLELSSWACSPPSTNCQGILDSSESPPVRYFQAEYIPIKPPTIEELAAHYSQKYGVNLAITKLVIRIESNGDQDAISSAGSVGLMQIHIRSTAAFLWPSASPSEYVFLALDPERNIEAGVRYLRYIADQLRLDAMDASNFSRIYKAYHDGLWSS